MNLDMQFWILLIFSIMQGILEWLPVSSEGQTVTVLVSFFNIDPQDAFKIALFLHLGTLIAVSLKFRKDLYQYVNFKNRDEDIVRWRRFIVLTTVGTVITGVPIYFIVKYYAFSPSIGEYVMLVIGVALIITAILLYLSKKVQQERKSILDMSIWLMIFVGMLQGFAIIPGISRSGITMSGLLLLSIKKDEALKGSFLMSIPAVIGGIILDLASSFINQEEILILSGWEVIAAITITAMIGYLTIETFLFVARKYNFAIICLILGVLTILLFIIKFL